MDELDYYYRDIVDGASDADSVDSSDDDTDYKRLFDHGKHLSKEDKEVLLANGALYQEEDSNLSFEREMEKEAANHVNGFHVNLPPPDRQRQLTLPAAADAETLLVPVASTSKTREQVNDELFYDPDEDDHDQAWADAHRSQHLAPPPPNATQLLAAGNRQRQLAESSRLKKPQSDATLNCPCCLATLCLDCQRHDIYKTQYRAMFVLNCRIDYTKKLLYRDKEERKKPFKRSKKHRNDQPPVEEAAASQPEGPTAERDLYYPVHCSTCSTQVGLYDIEQVYHFFSVLASH